MPLTLTGHGRKESFARADELLEQVGLADRGGHLPSKLSGGQMQRVAVAHGLGHDPPLLLADEPTANLDHIQAEAIIRVLQGLRDDGRMIVVSTHDSRLVPIADRIVQMVPVGGHDEVPTHDVTYAAGESVFEQEDPSELVYVVKSGEVDVIRVLADGGEELLTELGPDQYFGELGPFLGFPRSASVRAHTDVVLTAYGPASVPGEGPPQDLSVRCRSVAISSGIPRRVTSSTRCVASGETCGTCGAVPLAPRRSRVVARVDWCDGKVRHNVSAAERGRCDDEIDRPRCDVATPWRCAALRALESSFRRSDSTGASLLARRDHDRRSTRPGGGQRRRSRRTEFHEHARRPCRQLRRQTWHRQSTSHCCRRPSQRPDGCHPAWGNGVDHDRNGFAGDRVGDGEHRRP